MTTSDQQQAASDRNEIKRLVTTASEEGRVDRQQPRKRALARFHADMHLDVTTDVASEEASFPVIMHNITDAGFAFWSRQKVRVRTQIWVREFSGEDPNPWLEAHVTHCTLGLRGHLVGAKFGHES